MQHFTTIETVRRTLEPDALICPMHSKFQMALSLLTTSDLSRTFVAFSLWLQNCLTLPNKVQMKEELEKRQKEVGDSKVFRRVENYMSTSPLEGCIQGATFVILETIETVELLPSRRTAWRKSVKDSAVSPWRRVKRAKGVHGVQGQVVRCVNFMGIHS